MDVPCGVPSKYRTSCRVRVHGTISNRADLVPFCLLIWVSFFDGLPFEWCLKGNQNGTESILGVPRKKTRPNYLGLVSLQTTVWLGIFLRMSLLWTHLHPCVASHLSRSSWPSLVQSKDKKKSDFDSTRRHISLSSS